MTRVPRLWRKRRGRGGKFYGNFLATIGGQDVNLGTSNAEIARERLPLAMKGQREFSSAAQDAAAAQEKADMEGARAANAGQVAAGTTPEAAPAPSPPITPDAVIPPAPAAAPTPTPAPAPAAALPPLPPRAEAEARAEADATNAAAQETAGAAGDAPANDNADPPLPPEVLEQLLTSCGQAMVEVQLELQAFIIKKRTGKEPGKVPPNAPIRPIAAQAWVAQFKRWFPEIDNFPPWVIAVALPALCIPVQVATAKPAAPPAQGESANAAENMAQAAA